MKTTILASLALTLLPALAYANCPVSERTAMACETGQTWDAATHRCVSTSS
ncbi:hypothetical protein [Paenirhodobacter populi]|uniref:hypothetical protein n=1 Tax=Paenirhodobacter populi TaxID=2306993 RepID=UPI0013E368B8|nr:hypothetical protein [Sinirhodobacter populi]